MILLCTNAIPGVAQKQNNLFYPKSKAFSLRIKEASDSLEIHHSTIIAKVVALIIH